MSDQTTVSLPQKKAPVFRGSLVRSVVLQFIIIALIPAAIIGAASYYRYQTSLTSSLSTQLNAFAVEYSLQMDQSVADNQSLINKVSSETAVSSNLQSEEYGLLAADDAASREIVNEYLSSQVAANVSSGVSEISIVSNVNGFVLASSDEERVGTILTDDAYLKSLYGTNTTILTFNPGGLFYNKLMLVSAKTIQKSDQLTPVTVLLFSSPTALSTILANPAETYTSAHVFFITSDNQYVSLNPVTNNPVSVQVAESEKSKIEAFAYESQTGQQYEYISYTGINVFSYIKPLDTIKSFYILEIPKLYIDTPLSTFQEFILYLLGGTLVVSGIFAFLATRQIALPLVQLSGKARQFAGGDFSQKANVSRRDEIGLLAYSFNFMVDQLSEFYQSLESKVADRTRELQLATEIGQDAIAATRKLDILQNVVKAVVEKFNVPFAAIFLVDEKKSTLTLADRYSTLTEGLPTIGSQVPLDNTSFVGWIANNVQPRISQDISNEKLRLTEGLHLVSAASEIGVPITIADRLIGVLNIQSEALNAFDIESVPTYATLANQIANGLRNIELLESTQANLQETAVLYQASREISTGQNDEEIYEKISPVFEQSTFACFVLDLEEKNAVIRHIADKQSSAADRSLIGISIPFSEAIQKLATDGTTIITNFQLLNEFSQLTPYFGRRGCFSIAILPVYEGSSMLHALAIGSRSEAPLNITQVRPYETFAQSIGVTYDRIHLAARLSEAQKEFAVVDAIANNNLENSTILDLSSYLHMKAKELFGENTGLCIAINDEEHKQIDVPYFHDGEMLTVENYDYSNDLMTQLIRSKENRSLDDAIAEGSYVIDSPAFQRPARAWMGFPMLIGGSAIGGIGFFNPDAAGIYNDEHRKVGALITSMITLAISDRIIQGRLETTRNLYEEEQFLLESLLQNTSDRVSFKNKNNEFVRVSKSLADFLGVRDASDLVGRSDDFHYVMEDEATNANVDSEVVSTQTPVLGKLETWTNRFGVSESLVSNKLPLQKQLGEVYGLLSISRNITDQIKIEQLAKHREDQLLTASDIAKESTTGSMDVQVTLARLVELIRSRFGFYHASIFLIDPLGKDAILRESTGDAGAQMKSAGHKLAVGSTSIVGQATGKAIPVVIGDVTKEENYFANPMLPETRSELAIPLKIGEKVLGALDVQSKNMDAFSQEDINILQVLADQIAVAIQNADLYTKTNQSLTRYRLLHQVTSSNVQNLSVDDAIHRTVEVLHQAMPSERITFFGIDEKNLLLARASAGYPTPDLTTRRIQFGHGAIGLAASERKAIRVDDAKADHANRPLGFDTNSILAVPVVFADQLLGVVNIESTVLALFDEADQEFVTSLADNIASIISNVRLLDQVRDQIERQQQLFDITNKIRRSVDIETIMQTSVSEICTAMNLPRATIRISPTVLEENNQEKES